MSKDGSADEPRGESESVQYTSISFGGLGVRARADGRSGREAWRILWRRNPLLACAGGAYIALLVALIIMLASRLA